MLCPPRPGGEIGRRRGLKIPRRKACRFDSGPGHHLIFQTVQESLMNPLSLWDGGFFVG